MTGTSESKKRRRRENEREMGRKKHGRKEENAENSNSGMNMGVDATCRQELSVVVAVTTGDQRIRGGGAGTSRQKIPTQWVYSSRELPPRVNCVSHLHETKIRMIIALFVLLTYRAECARKKT